MPGLSGIEASLWQQSIKVLAVLTGLVGILYLGVHLLKKFRVTRLGEPSCIRVLETHYLTPKATLHLVAVGPARFLVGNAGERLTLLTALPLRDEEGEEAPKASITQSLFD